MRGVSCALGFIGAVYAIGLAIHFWWIIVAALLAIYGHELITKSKTRHPARTEAGPVNTSQARYSNRR